VKSFPLGKHAIVFTPASCQRNHALAKKEDASE